MSTPDSTITYPLAMAAGRDAGNRNAATHGRTVWTRADWNAAARATAKLLQVA